MKRILKRVIIGIGVTICISLTIPSYAASVVNDDIQNTNSSQISPRVEVTKWYYRVKNGVRQKRLWSVTYGYWKTDWINY